MFWGSISTQIFVLNCRPSKQDATTKHILGFGKILRLTEQNGKLFYINRGAINNAIILSKDKIKCTLD